MSKTAPVENEHASEANQAASSATSSGRPRRAIGILETRSLTTPGSVAADTATSRVLVHQDVAGEFVDLLSARVDALVQGVVHDPAVTMGPMIAAEDADRAAKVISEAVSVGATLVSGGSRLDGDLAHGNFLAPTILAEVPVDADAWTSELFAPVLAVRTVRDLAEAVEQVNATNFGLSAALFSRRIDEIEEFCRKVDAGQVAINLPTTGWDVHMPFGGFKESGSAFKEQGLVGLAFYQRTKTIALAP